MKRQRLRQQLRPRHAARGIGAVQRRQLRRGLPQPGHGLLHRLHVGRRERGQALQPVEHVARGVGPALGQRPQRRQVPRLGLQQRGQMHGPRLLRMRALHLLRRHGQRGGARLTRGDAGLTLLARVGQARLHHHELLEPEHRAERVVERRGPVLQQRAQLVVGEERPERAERARPAERVERLRLAALGLGGDHAGAQVRVRAPRARGHERPLALDQQLRGDRRRLGLMQVAPAQLPRLGAPFPAQAGAGEQHLRAFGEARLAGAVAPDHQREAGAGMEGQGGGGADAAEAGDGDGAEEDAGRFDGGGVCGLAPWPSPRGLARAG